MIRWAEDKDYLACSEMLTIEGVPLDGQMHRTLPTWVCEEDGEILGFYTLSIINNRPAIQHVCVKRESRKHPRIIRELMKHLIEWCVRNGHDHVYAHARKDKEGVKRAIEYYFKAKSYHYDDKKELYWYFLTIKGGKNENL